MKKYITKNYKQTQKLGENFAKDILKIGLKDGAVVLGLQGNLGGGKTTFLQGFAKGLGVGIMGGSAMALGGVGTGVAQIGRGMYHTPGAVKALSEGKVPADKKYNY
jgi:ribosomal protein L18